MLIARKIANAGELLWDSLDSQERTVLLYLAGYLLLMVAAGLRRRSRDNLKRELRDELEAATVGRS